MRDSSGNKADIKQSATKKTMTSRNLGRAGLAVP